MGRLDALILVGSTRNLEIYQNSESHPAGWRHFLRPPLGGSQTNIGRVPLRGALIRRVGGGNGTRMPFLKSTGR